MTLEVLLDHHSRYDDVIINTVEFDTRNKRNIEIGITDEMKPRGLNQNLTRAE